MPVLDCDSTTDALPAILKFLRKTKETLGVESVFSIVICGWLGQLEFVKRNAIKGIFLIIFITSIFPLFSVKNTSRDFFRSV